VGKFEYSEAFKHTTVCCFTLFGLSLFMLSASVDDAEAQSRAALCRSLNSQLASLSGSSGGGNPAQYRKFNNAANSQKAQIKKTKRIAKRGRCTGFGIFNSRSAQCKRIVGSLKKMEANLRSLRSKAAQYAPKRTNTKSKRKTLLRRIKQNRCNAVVTKQVKEAKKVTKPKRKTLLEQVFGTKTYDQNGSRVNSGQNQVLTNLRTYRTLCVRKTDGYYFPISFSTSKDRFEDDQQTCQKMCPSSEVDLYHHKMPSEDSEEMVHYQTKKPYAKEPFAFAYRKSFDVNQKCRFATENRSNSIETVTVEKKESIKIGTPVWREDPALAPDDHESLIAGLNFKVVKAFVQDDLETGDNADNQLLADNRKIRIVGPAFFPVQ
jgi:hypothetical protein